MTDRELPMMPWFPKDFATATAAWSFAEASVYRCLLDAQWLTGPLPDDPIRLARIAKCDPAVFDDAWSTVRTKFELVDGKRVNARLEEHREESYRRKDAAAANGSKGGKASAQARLKQGSSKASTVAGADVVAKSNPPSPSPSPSISEENGPSAPLFDDGEDAPEENHDLNFLFRSFLPICGEKNRARLAKLIKTTRYGEEVVATMAREVLEQREKMAQRGEPMHDPFSYLASRCQVHSKARVVV